MKDIKRISIICGHYGCGKTNFAVNLALDLAKSNKSVTIIDLDIVNPYFRVADFTELFLENNIKLLAPQFANTNLDLPVLPQGIVSAINNEDEYLIIDVGGDDAGAVALGGFAKEIQKYDYDMYYVVNAYRFLTGEVSDNLELMNNINFSSRLQFTKIVNNSNLGAKTTLENIKSSTLLVDELATLSNLPVAFTTSADFLNLQNEYYPVKIFVKSSWD